MSRKSLIAAFAACLLALAFAGPAQAKITIEEFKTTSSDPQAGGHPDLTTEFTLADPGNPEVAKNVAFNAPEGVFGNPNAISRCTASDFALSECPVNSQAGVITIWANYNGQPDELLGISPVYDMVPALGETARFQFVAPTVNIPIAIPVEVRTGGDYGLRFSVAEITQQIPLQAAKFTLWGMPALPSHDAERFQKGSPDNPATCPGQETASCGNTHATVSIPVRPLINYPTVCTGEPLQTVLTVQSYQHPQNLSTETDEYPPVEGCDRETFRPVLSASLTTDEADSASGLNLGFHVPQTLGFTPSPSQVRSVIVTLPPGLTINPDAADGQSACSDDDANFDSEGPAACQDNAKIGTITVGTPALDGPLIGSIYIGEPKPGDQYRLFMVVSGFGMNIKLVGSVVPDPQTGRLTARFVDLPQVPFEDYDIHLFASDRGLMATPTHCTLYGVVAAMVPWNNLLANQSSEANLSLAQGPNRTLCPGQVRPFAPRLVAGMSNPLAGNFSTFHLKLDRDDGHQFLGDLNFKLPPGFTGNLRGISYCPEPSIAAAAGKLGRAEQAAASCPASSQIGTSNVAAGPGSHPFHAIGKMYLAGPFKGAPLSLVAITPALAGPYDYGVVVVRVALHVDPLTAQVSAVSDTVPSIIGGIPIRMRSIQVNIDRPEFTINPTNCSQFSVDSQGIGEQGTVTDFSSFFHAVNCLTLPFRPSMSVRLMGKRKTTRRSKNPELRFDLFTRSGDANIKAISVTLPSAFEIDQRHLGNICSEKELAATQCAGRTPIGKAMTTTPLLDQPLEGPAYAVSGSGGLPRLAFILNGQVNLTPRADTTTVAGHLKTTVPVVPDAPVGHFRLTVFGGKTGYLINTRSLCSQPSIRIDYAGQNNKHRHQSVKVKTPCSAKAQKRARRHHG
jgi:hypothetical protein